MHGLVGAFSDQNRRVRAEERSKCVRVRCPIARFAINAVLDPALRPKVAYEARRGVDPAMDLPVLF
eukprot:428459-Rhodomonas_salina.1